MRFPSRNPWRCLSWFAVGCVMWHGAFAIEAGSLYVYTDAQGQAVLTDNLQQVPPEYRGRLRAVAGGESSTAEAPAVVERSAATGRSPSSNVIESMLHLVAQKVHPFGGLTAHQTAVLIVGGACLVALLCLLFLSANPAIRLLAKFLLVMVSLTTLYQLVIAGTGSVGPLTGTSQQASEQAADNIMGQVKTKTQKSYRLQDERTTRQLDQAELSNR